MYANASNNTPFYTYVSSYMVWSVHPKEVALLKQTPNIN